MKLINKSNFTEYFPFFFTLLKNISLQSYEVWSKSVETKSLI